MDTITMISGEIIKGIIVEENKLYVYIKTSQDFINQLPKNEIASISRAFNIKW